MKSRTGFKSDHGWGQRGKNFSSPLPPPYVHPLLNALRGRGYPEPALFFPQDDFDGNLQNHISAILTGTVSGSNPQYRSASLGDYTEASFRPPTDVYIDEHGINLTSGSWTMLFRAQTDSNVANSTFFFSSDRNDPSNTPSTNFSGVVDIYRASTSSVSLRIAKVLPSFVQRTLSCGWNDNAVNTLIWRVNWNTGTSEVWRNGSFVTSLSTLSGISDIQSSNNKRMYIHGGPNPAISGRSDLFVLWTSSLDSSACLELSGLSDPVDFHVPGRHDTDRTYVDMFFPSDYDPDSSYPLIVLLHGWSGSQTQIEGRWGFNSIIDSEQFILMIPQGKNIGGLGDGWNAGACCQVNEIPIDDVSYLYNCIIQARNQYAVDASRVFIVGESNGGFMAHRMAIEHSNVISAICSISGVGPNSSGSHNPSAPVSILHMHGLSDNVVSASGGNNILGYSTGPHPAAWTTLARWATANGCDLSVVTGSTYSTVSGSVDDTVAWIMPSGSRGTKVEYHRVTTSNHSFSPISGTVSTRIVQWLKSNYRNP